MQKCSYKFKQDHLQQEMQSSDQVIVLSFTPNVVSTLTNSTSLAPSVCLSSDVCKSPTEVPKFEWISRYHKTPRSQGVVKQALAPLGTSLTKLGQQQKTGLCSSFY